MLNKAAKYRVGEKIKSFNFGKFKNLIVAKRLKRSAQ